MHFPIRSRYLRINSQHIKGIREGKVLSVRCWSTATHREVGYPRAWSAASSAGPARPAPRYIPPERPADTRRCPWRCPGAPRDEGGRRHRRQQRIDDVHRRGSERQSHPLPGLPRQGLSETGERNWAWRHGEHEPHHKPHTQCGHHRWLFLSERQGTRWGSGASGGAHPTHGRAHTRPLLLWPHARAGTPAAPDTPSLAGHDDQGSCRVGRRHIPSSRAPLVPWTVTTAPEPVARRR
jgi:hypothetical protein